MNHRFNPRTHYTNTLHPDLNRRLGRMINPWTAMKKRFQTKTAKAIRDKAFMGVKLVGTGAALTGGAMLLEEGAKPKMALAVGHDNVYATDNGAHSSKLKRLLDRRMTESPLRK